jgi:hypothetical protein
MSPAPPETLMSSAKRFGRDWNRWSEDKRLFLMLGMSPAEMVDLSAYWHLFAHEHQRPPKLASNGKPWLT